MFYFNYEDFNGSSPEILVRLRKTKLLSDPSLAQDQRKKLKKIKNT